MKFIKVIGAYDNEEFYINPENVNLLSKMIVYENGERKEVTKISFLNSSTLKVSHTMNELVEMLEDKKHGSFDTDDFFNAAVERAYRKTNTCACCGIEIPEGWQICVDCADELR